MSFGNHRYERESFMVVLGPLTPERIVRAPEQIRSYLLSDMRRDFMYFRPTSDRPWQDVPATEYAERVERSLRRLDYDPSPSEFYALFDEHDHPDLGAAFLITPRFVGFAMPHFLFDGRAGLDHITAMMRGDTSMPRYLRHPRLTALKHNRMLRPKPYRDAVANSRAMWEVMKASRAVVPFPSLPIRVELTQFTIDRDELKLAKKAISREENPDGTRLLPSTALIARIIMRTVDRLIAPERDLIISMPIDLRRYLPNSQFVRGNFSSHQNVGTLRGEVWTGATFRDRVFPNLAGAEPLAISTALEVVQLHDYHYKRWVRRQIGRFERRLPPLRRGMERRRSRKQAAAPTERLLELSMNILQGSMGLEPRDWEDGARSTISALPIFRSHPMLGFHVAALLTATGDVSITFGNFGDYAESSRIEQVFREEARLEGAGGELG